MDIVYLDSNCYQRSFDDPLQTRIQMEALACQEIFARVVRREIELAWSFIHEDEVRLCPFPDRAAEVVQLSALCVVRVGPNEQIRIAAMALQGSINLSAKDALHLAAAQSINAGFFVTCDASWSSGRPGSILE